MRQRKCKKIVPMLEDFRRGSLTPEETKVVKTHLAGCPSCRTTLTDTGRLVALLQKEVRVDPEPAFWEGLKNRIMTEVRHHSEKGSRSPWTFRGLSRLFPVPAYAWGPALIFLILFPLIFFQLMDRKPDRYVSTAPMIPQRAMEEPYGATPPEPLPTVLAALTEKESIRLAKRMSTHLSGFISEETAPGIFEEKGHWDLHRSLQGLKEEELNTLVEKLDPGNSAGLKEERPYVC